MENKFVILLIVILLSGTAMGVNTFGDDITIPGYFKGKINASYVEGYNNTVPPSVNTSLNLKVNKTELNASIEVNISQVSGLQGLEDIQNTSISALQNNDTNANHPYSYIIFRNNTAVLARNTSTGVVEYSGAAENVFRSVLMNHNGEIYTKKGTYNYLGNVRPQFGKSDTKLICEPGTKITYDVDNVAIAISANLRNITILGCTFESLYSGTGTDNYIFDTGANLQNIFLIENTFIGYRTPGRPIPGILNFADDGGSNYHKNINIIRNTFINKNTTHIDATIAGISIKYFNGLYVDGNKWYNINNDVMPATVTPRTNYDFVYANNVKYQTSNKTDGEGPDIATTNGILYMNNRQYTDIPNGSVDPLVSFGGLGGDQAAPYKNFMFVNNQFNCTNNGISMATTWEQGVIANNVFDNIGQCGGAGQKYSISFDPSGTFINITISNNIDNNSNLGMFRVNNGETKTNVRIDDISYAGYNFGVLSLRPSARVANQFYINSSKSVPNQCQSTSAGVGGWVFSANGSVGC